MKKIFTTLLTISLLFVLTVCSAPLTLSSKASGNEIDTFIIGTTAEITTANRSEYNFDVISGTLSQLAPVYIDGEGNYHPLLCDYSTKDSKTWTFTVRDGMTWHDGTPVTADDIKFTFEYLDTQGEEGGYAERFTEIRVIDDKTVEFELPQANPRELANMVVVRIMPEHIYEGVEDYTTVPNEQANIGCGPYKFSRFDADAGVVEFEAFTDYPDGAPKAKTVTLKLYDNPDTMYMALKSGEIDMVYKYSGGVDAGVISDLEDSGNLTLMPVSNTANSAALILNNNTAPGNDINVRKAIASAIDYEKFRELFGSAYAIPSTAGFIPEGTYGYVDTPVLTRDLDAARQYLEDGGYTDSDGDGFVEKDGQKLSISVMVRDDKPDHARYAELLQTNLAEIGIEITLDVQEVAAFRELTEQQRSQQAVITGLTAFGMAKNQGLAALYLWGENPMSYGQVYDEAYKALLDKADAAASMDEYKRAAAEIQEYYAENLPAVALFWDAHVQAYNSRFSGFSADGTFGILNVQTWMDLAEAQ